jgi:hypothetical protein
MKIDFRGSNSRVHYDIKFTSPEQKHFTSGTSRLCYGTIFNYLDGYTSSRNIEGVYTITCKKVYRGNNFCMLTKDQIKSVLRYMRTTFQIGTRLKEDDENYYITFKINGKKVKHKFVMSFSRVFYELPYTLYASEVFRLRKAERYQDVYYKNMNFLELYQLVTHTYGNEFGYTTNKLFLENYIALDVSVKTIQNYINRSNPRIQPCFENSKCSYRRKYTIKDLYNYYDIDWDENMEMRFDNYNKLFKIIKNEKSTRRRSTN